MRSDLYLALRAGVIVSFATVLAALGFSATALAQTDQAEATDEDTEVRATDEVIVTGSRLKRDTFSSVAPLQVISGQVSREIGSIDPSTILQESTASAGTQIDITFQGFVLDNGPGSSTIDLRGLGAERTLVLINGRRAAPVGVEGAPFAPDLNIIPSSLVDRYEILTDGASSVYGSDAIAGVSNIILRKDFDGFEFEAYSTIPEYSRGTQDTISAAWGLAGDRGSFGIAADYSRLESVPRDNRPWSEGCESYYEQTTTGEIRTEFIGYQADFGMNTSPCRIGFGARRVFDVNPPLFGSIYYTPGETNTGIPNYSEATLIGVVADLNDDGVPDVDFTDYFITSELGETHLFPEQDRVSVMAIGEYTFAGEMNVTPYIEVLYNKRETFALSLGAALFQEVPADNPFNPCNPNGTVGVDCGSAYDAFITDPGYLDDFLATYGGFCASIGLTPAQCTPTTFGFAIGPIGPAPIEAQVGIKGDRNFVESEVDQLRVVAGIRGDLPQLSFGSLDNWSFDVAVVASDGTGTSLRQGVNEERLLYSLETSRFSVPGDPTSPVICGNNDGCVPVDLFAPSLYEGLTENDFATQAERDYLFSNRTFDTTYKQSLASGIITGDLFSLPAGPVAAAIGYEYRHDEIDSIPNDVARDGLLWGFFRDLGAVGEKDTEEYFVEVELPLLANVPAFKELTANISSRHTDDEFYGGAWTYSGKLAWRPVDSLLIKGTVGTSYRAPNLRENFLQGTSGFLTVADPCVTPENSLVLAPGGGLVYDPTMDTRTQTVIDNCFAQGVDPTNLGIIASGATTETYSVEVLTGVGQADLVEEQSESFTAGFAWDQPFFSAFDLTIGATYYEVELEDEIIELSATFSVSDCYNDSELDSPYCANISRNLGGDGLINQIDEAFLNRDSLKTRGLDITVALDFPTQIFGRAVDISADLNFNRKYEFSDAFIPLDGSAPSIDSDLGEFGFPEWEGQGIFRVDFDKYRATWSTRYLGGVEADPDTLAANGFGNWNDGSNFTCLGVAAGDVDCRPVGWADNYFRHDASFYYYGDVWTLGIGARNVLNEKPPLVDRRVVFSRWNVPFGSGYDVNGRSYFFNVAARFQ